MTNHDVYGGFTQALFFSGSVAVPRLLLDHYRDLGITDREMMLLIHLIAENSEAAGDNPEATITRKMGLPPLEYQKLVQSLQDRGLLAAKPKRNPEQPYYDFSGLIDQLFELWGINQFKQMEASDQKGKEDTGTSGSARLTTLFEQELGRPLTGFECEHIEKWLLSGNSEELIIEALRRGVSAGIRNFRYLDSILREWEKKGIKSRQEVEAEDEYFQSRQAKKGEKQAKPSAQIKNKYDNLYL